MSLIKVIWWIATRLSISPNFDLSVFIPLGWIDDNAVAGLKTLIISIISPVYACPDDVSWTCSLKYKNTGFDQFFPTKAEPFKARRDLVPPA